MSRERWRSPPATEAPRELELRFWWLVLLAKLLVLVLAAGLIVTAFTEYRLAGIALTLLGVGLGVRWAYLLRKSRRAIETGEFEPDRP